MPSTLETERPVVFEEAPVDLQPTPLVGERWALSMKHLLITIWFGSFFMHFNYIPLFHSDIWGHVSYGHWILEHQALPTEDPFVALTEGVSIVDTAWLGQVLLASAEKIGGSEWLSHVFAVSVLLAYLVLARVFYLQTGRSGLATIGAILVWIVGWSRHAIARPEVFGSLCLALLLWAIIRFDKNRKRVFSTSSHQSKDWPMWIGISVLFAAWANLHGSYVVGFGVLGCYLLGRAIEVLWSTRSFVSLLQDRVFRRWLIWTELAVAASLLNPYGIDLLIHTLLFPGNHNLNDVLEWFRLEMVSYEGIEIGFSWMMMLVVLRHSRAKMKPSDILLLAVFTLAICLRVRMITWYAPIVILVLMPHIADVVKQLQAYWFRNAAISKTAVSLEPAPLTAGSFRYTLLCGLVVWVCFAFSPISRPVLSGKPRSTDHVYGNMTPLGVTKYLREHPPQGQIANPQWWGDWLVWDGPPDLQVFMTTNAVHVTPARIWKDYMILARGGSGMEQRLDRYRINTIVVHKELQPRLTRLVRRDQNWKIAYEDEIGLVAVRRSTSQTEENEKTKPTT